jgi:hypothetical protein
LSLTALGNSQANPLVGSYMSPVDANELRRFLGDEHLPGTAYFQIWGEIGEESEGYAALSEVLFDYSAEDADNHMWPFSHRQSASPLTSEADPAEERELELFRPAAIDGISGPLPELAVRGYYYSTQRDAVRRRH